MGGKLARFRGGEVPSARKLNTWADEIERVGKWRGVPPINISDDAAGFVAQTSDPVVFQWFYTTSTITTATASATGTAIGSATMSDGSGTARRCVETGTGGAETRVPDTSSGATDETIWCPVVTGTTIATGSFVRAAWVANRWELDMPVRCPGT